MRIVRSFMFGFFRWLWMFSLWINNANIDTVVYAQPIASHKAQTITHTNNVHTKVYGVCLRVWVLNHTSWLFILEYFCCGRQSAVFPLKIKMRVKMACQLVFSRFLLYLDSRRTPIRLVVFFSLLWFVSLLCVAFHWMPVHIHRPHTVWYQKLKRLKWKEMKQNILKKIKSDSIGIKKKR